MARGGSAACAAVATAATLLFVPLVYSVLRRHAAPLPEDPEE